MVERSGGRWGFVLAAMVGVFIFAGIVGSLVAWVLLTQTENLIRKEATREIQAHLAPGIAQALSSEDLTSPLGEARYEIVDAKIREHVEHSDVLRIKVWNRDGTVVYSSLREQVGESDHSDAGLAQSLRGAVAYGVLEELESADDRGGGALLEIFLPLSWTGGAIPDAVLEVYQDYTPYTQLMESLRRNVITAAGLVFSLLPIALYVLYRVGWAQFTREHAEAAQRAIEVEALNTLLQHDISSVIELRETIMDLQREMALDLPAPDDPRYEAHVAAVRKQVAALVAHCEAVLTVPKREAEVPDRPDAPDPSREHGA